MDLLLKMAAENARRAFNILLTSTESGVISKRDLGLLKQKLSFLQNNNQTKIYHFKNTDNVRFVRVGNVIISMKVVLSAIEAHKISTFLKIEVSSRIVWENITNRFLLFNVSVDIPLLDVGQEISEINNIQILELRRFMRPPRS